jgi:mono/diheme cytochrome c family protein
MNKRFLQTFSALSVIYLLLFACQGGEEAIRKAQFITNGQKLYVTHCQNCHGAKGEGLGKLYPPLTDQEFLKKNRQQLSCIVAHGMTGEIVINGEAFDTPMPANPQLTPLDIAYVLTYITNAFGNQADAFTLKEVEEALKNCRKQNLGQ